MAKFKITYITSVGEAEKTEEVEATSYEDVDGKWIDFFKAHGPRKDKQLRVQAAGVERVERVD